MFGYRSDGVKLKNIPPFFKVIPLLMKTRNDSQVYYSEDLPISSLDEYIAEKASEGIKITYMHIFYAALVRMMAIRPHLNRFVINGFVIVLRLEIGSVSSSLGNCFKNTYSVSEIFFITPNFSKSASIILTSFLSKLSINKISSRVNLLRILISLRIFCFI